MGCKCKFHIDFKIQKCFENGSFWYKNKDYSQFYNIKKTPSPLCNILKKVEDCGKRREEKLEGERINCFFTWMAHLMCTKYNIVVVDLDITISSEKRKVASWDVNEHMRFFHAPNNVHFFQLKNQSILKCIVIDRWKESSVTKTKLFSIELVYSVWFLQWGQQHNQSVTWLIGVTLLKFGLFLKGILSSHGFFSWLKLIFVSTCMPRCCLKSTDFSVENIFHLPKLWPNNTAWSYLYT